MAAHSLPKGRTRRSKGPAIFVLASLAAFVAALIAVSLNGSGGSSGSKPKPARPLSAHAREVAAITAWYHSDGDMMYVQTEQALAAFRKAEASGRPKRITATAVTLWQDAGITLRTPPPAGTAQWTTALRDLEHAAQLAGGDPGAPTGTGAQVLRWLRRFDRHIAAATAAVDTLSR